jgi:hypothetical protein
VRCRGLVEATCAWFFTLRANRGGGNSIARRGHFGALLFEKAVVPLLH